MEASSSTWRQVRKLENHYRFVRVLGSGTFGTCFLVESLATRKQCVLKAIHEDLTDEVAQEVDILINISQSHPGIVSYIDHFALRFLPDDMAAHCRYECTHCIITEFIEGDTLLAFCRKVKAGEVKLTPALLHSLMASGAAALAFLHEEAHIAHRDLKPANMLVCREQQRLVLIDFGLSVELAKRGRAPQDDCGTPNYFSPDLVLMSREEERATRSMWFASDVWGLGAALYLLCTGTEIARLHTNRERSFDEVLAFTCPPVIYEGNTELNTILRDMLSPDYHTRPTAAALVERLSTVRLLRARTSLPAIPCGVSASTTTVPKGLRARPSALQARNAEGGDLGEEEPIARRTRQMQLF
jgi:serine/threonine protein kinase